MLKNLETKIFKEEEQRKVFGNLLETLDNITPKWINREEYNSKE
jgi:hypothetical protein